MKQLTSKSINDKNRFLIERVKENKLLLDIGGINILIRSHKVLSVLRHQYKAFINFISSKKVFSNIDLYFNFYGDIPEKNITVPKGANYYKFYFKQHHIITIQFQNNNKDIVVIFHYRVIDKFLFPRVSWLLMQCFYPKLIHSYRGLILHAAAIIVEKTCFILLGEHDAGKSTIAHLCYKKYGRGSILNDDRILVRKENNKLLIYGTPWVGGKTTREGEHLSSNSKIIYDSGLQNVIFLHISKARTNKILTINKKKQYKYLLKALTPQVHLPRKIYLKAKSILFDYFKEITVKEFYFCDNSSVIDFLSKY